MLPELTDVSRKAVLPLFDAPHLALVARAVVCGNGPGRFWADDPASPTVALLWDQGRHVYLAGDLTVAGMTGLCAVLRGTVLPAICAAGRTCCEVHASCDALARVTEQLLPGAVRRARLLLAATGPGVPFPVAPLDPTLQIRPIDTALLGDESLGHVQAVRDEVAGMWGSLEAFLRGGFGYCIVSEREIVCWCTAEYVSPGWCGVGIETVRTYQRRGLATAVARAFRSHCAARDIRMHWDCWVDNIPSVRVAEKTGLVPIERFEVACGTITGLQRRM